jgi:hypothetical protein
MSFQTLLSKQGRIIIALGYDFLSRQAGERILTVQDYAERCETSVGTIQNAQAYLQQEGMVKLQPRGHQGTYLLEIDRHALWRLVHPNDLVGAMPLPYSVRYEGLATALNECISHAGLSLNIVFMRGASMRLRALIDGRCDFAVLSAFAAAHSQQDKQPISTIVNLGAGTYVSEHVMVFREPGHEQIADGMRVGIDPQSPDQAHLTQQACAGHNVTLVEISYMQLTAALQRGLIDATVWNSDEVKRHSGLYAVSLPEHLAESITSTQAAIVTREDAMHLKTLLTESLDTNELTAIQAQVMRGDRLPQY